MKLAAILLVAAVPAAAQVIDDGIRRGGVYTPGHGWDYPVRKVLPPANAGPQWWRRNYGPPPNWNQPPVRCFGQSWDPRGCQGRWG